MPTFIRLRGEPAATQERVETVIALADEYGLPVWMASADPDCHRA
jgi:hypothetical protein